MAKFYNKSAFNMKLPVLFLIVWLGYVLPVKAQDTLLISFQDAVKIGLQQNQNFQIRKNEQHVLKMERQAAIMGHLPRVNINNNLFRQMGQQYQQLEGQLVVTNVTNDLLTTGLNANLPIFNSGRRLFTTRATRQFEEAGSLNLHRASQDVVFEIAQQYLQILLDQELYRIAVQNLENQKEQLRQIEGFVEAGLRTLSDQYNQQSEVARLTTVVLDAEIQLETDMWQFAETLQLESNTIPELLPLDLETVPSEFLDLGLDELYELATNNRQDFRAQKLLVGGQKDMISAARSFYYPQINGFFNYNTFFTSLDERSFRDQYMRIYPQRTFGINITIPIFNNFENRVAVARSKMEHNNQSLELNAIERRLTQETKLAFENYRVAIKREEATKVQLEAAEVAQQVIEERFRLGVSNFVDLAQANQQLVTAQSDHAQARYTHYFQEVILRYTLGVLEVK
ncbi:TolC family protein [Litoribacter alkaliphilus]|uniref:TolC family protein n=2 Tax=Litoribacter ruber TaxID=702568 RepID=A0AAP2CEC4_9BACT|nr:TolC family protein [Litoribacter alkaliphilus]